MFAVARSLAVCAARDDNLYYPPNCLLWRTQPLQMLGHFRDRLARMFLLGFFLDFPAPMNLVLRLFETVIRRHDLRGAREPFAQ